MLIWLGNRDGGERVDPRTAAVSVLDHGFTVGDGVFETLKCVDRQPFALTRHLRRLSDSAEGLALPRPDDAVIRHALDDLLSADVVPMQARLRITYTAGVAPLGSDRGASVPTLVVAIAPLQPWPPTAHVATVPWPRNERSPLVGIKSTSYADNVLALAGAHDTGASEALMPNTLGELCEGTGSNVFVVVDGRLLTPPLSSGCLGGITRELVLEWCDAAEEPLPMSVLEVADEVILSSSTRDLQPVHRIDDRVLASAPGPVTLAVMAEFERRSAADVDP